MSEFGRKIQAQLAEIAELRAQLAKLPDLEVGDFLHAGPLPVVSRVKTPFVGVITTVTHLFLTISRGYRATHLKLYL